MNDFNIDENMVNNLKNMINSGNLDDIISKIPPEVIQNFSSTVNNSSSNFDNSSIRTDENEPNYSNLHNSTSVDSNNVSDSTSGHNNFDFSNIDINTIMKMKSIMDKINVKDDPRTNLLRSLKPYLREERKSKVDQYANMMNIAKIAELFKNDSNRENNNDIS